jgi:hypothetical protein
MIFSLGREPGGFIHHQPWRLQDGHAVTQIADILSQKAGAHFLLPALEVKMIFVTKRSSANSKNIKFF